jgi:dTDP-4-amino-4,6-dideoxygalactose transaminase
VEEIVRRTDALLVEDAAQGLGAEWRGRPLGSLGDVSVLSFGRGKGWTGGAGGALLLHARHAVAPSLAGRARSAAGVWIPAAAQWLLGRPEAYWIPAGIPALALGETVYHTPEEPAPMPSVAASLALETEECSLAEVDVRRGNAALFLAALEDRGSNAFAWPLADSSFGTSGHLRLPLLAPEGLAAVRGPKARALGIMPGYPEPLNDLPEARTRAVSTPPGLPGAERLSRELVTLPTHSLMTAADRERIIARLRDPRPE